MSWREVEKSAQQLPIPAADAQLHSINLIKLIRQHMTESGGSINFSAFMHDVLYAPGLGYYSAGSHKFGSAGDFVTAPEISPLFSQCLARQCQQVLQAIGGGDILEIGAGSGVMALHQLKYLQLHDALPDQYYILEPSADLQQRQQRLLKEQLPDVFEKLEWLKQVPLQFCGAIVANEVLDAMPIHRFEVVNGKFQELFVKWEDEKFCWHTDKLSSKALQQQLQSYDLEFPDSYISEISDAIEPWVATLGDSLQRGAIILLDYGMPRHEYYHAQRDQGTLMCYYRHRSHSDPFVYPGLQDITAHVDFTSVAEAAVKSGLDVLGYNTQCHFLLANGIDQLYQQQAIDDKSRVLLGQQIKTLTLPSEMGESIKVMALAKHLDIPLSGFMTQDLRRNL